MGSKSLFVEHPSTPATASARPNSQGPRARPWCDPAKMPYSIAGPLLEGLFEKAFVGGLHTPQARPTAADWESALIKTIDLIQPCSSKCEYGYVFDNKAKPRCPFCGSPYQGRLPVLNLYSSRHAGSFQSDNHRGVMVWNGQSLFPWHVNRKVSPNEHLTPEQRKRVGYFQYLHQGDWYLVNEGMPTMYDVAARVDIPIGCHVKLSEGSQFLLSREDGGRLIQIQAGGLTRTNSAASLPPG